MQKVLIVEDDTIQLNMLYQTIHDAYPSWNIFCVSDYAAADRLILDSLQKSASFTLFLLDIQLTKDIGNRDGFFLAKGIRQHSAYYQTPILFLTAVSDENYFALSNFHCYNYISKPYTDADIRYQLQQMLMTGYLRNNTLELTDTQRILHRTSFCDILYIKSAYHVLSVFCEADFFQTRQYSLESILPMLDKDFIQCHKQYIINTSKVLHLDITSKIVTLTSNDSIPVGKSFLQDIERFYRKGTPND